MIISAPFGGLGPISGVQEGLRNPVWYGFWRPGSIHAMISGASVSDSTEISMPG